VKIAEQGLDWIKVGAGDVFYDLGCGDGRVAVVAAMRGARVVCVELDPTLADAASAAVKAAGVDDRVEVLREDLFTVDVSSATVVYIFLLPSLHARLRPIFESTLRPGTKVLSREFEIEGWLPGRQLELPGFLFLTWLMPGEQADCPAAPVDGARASCPEIAELRGSHALLAPGPDPRA
jgi:SAM-dependent methyltransferase